MPNHNVDRLWLFYNCNVFARFENTFQTVFWALFGMGDADVVELGESIRGGLTTRVGYFVFGVYNIAAVIICLNMLIAMMSSSFQNVLVSMLDVEALKSASGIDPTFMLSFCSHLLCLVQGLVDLWVMGI